VAQEGKPEAIRAKIVEGKVRKFSAERALVDQPFVKDESVTIGQMLGRIPGATVARFARFKVGEV
jgi:elongation factor Ts